MTEYFDSTNLTGLKELVGFFFASNSKLRICSSTKKGPRAELFETIKTVEDFDKFKFTLLSTKLATSLNLELVLSNIIEDTNSIIGTVLEPKWICLDFDSKIAWKAFETIALQGYFGNCLLNTTPRGGHIIFQNRDKTLCKRFSSGVVCKLGVKLELLGNGQVTIAGPNRGFKFVGDSKQISYLPSYFYPTSFRNPLLETFSILEGDRNTTLFKIANKLNPGYDGIYLLGKFFCSPPLEDEELKTISSAPQRYPKDTTASFESSLVLQTGLEQDANQSSKKGNRVEDVLADIGYFDILLEDRYRYNQNVECWYMYTGTHWVAIRKNVIKRLVSEVLTKSPEVLSRQVTASNMVAYQALLLEQLENNIFFSCDELSVPLGINLLNGYLLLPEKKLIAHTPKKFITQCMDIKWEPTAIISPALQSKIMEFFNSNLEAVHHFKTCIYRLLMPQPQLHTMYLLFGPPGFGKSTLVSLFEFIVGVNNFHTCEIGDLTQPFNRADFVGKRLNLFTEVQDIPPEGAKILKKLTGRDTISYGIKYQQGLLSFVSSAVTILTSNRPLKKLCSGNEGLLDRILVLKMDKKPKKKDPYLFSYLKENLPAIINWVLLTPPDQINALIRTEGSNYIARIESHPISDWFIDRFIFKEGEQITVDSVFNSYIEYNNETRNFKTSKKSNLVADILYFTKEVLNLEVKVQYIRTEPNKGSERINVFKNLAFKTRADDYIVDSLVNTEFGFDPWDHMPQGIQEPSTIQQSTPNIEEDFIGGEDGLSEDGISLEDGVSGGQTPLEDGVIVDEIPLEEWITGVENPFCDEYTEVETPLEDGLMEVETPLEDGVIVGETPLEEFCSSQEGASDPFGSSDEGSETETPRKKIVPGNTGPEGPSGTKHIPAKQTFNQPSFRRYRRPRNSIFRTQR